MEMKEIKYKILVLHAYLIMICLMPFFSLNATAQPIKNGITIGNGKAFLSLNRGIEPIELQGIVKHYELGNLPVEDWVQGKSFEKVNHYGWKIEQQTEDWLILSKPIEAMGDLTQLEKKILVAGGHWPGAELYPVGPFRREFGYNRLRQSGAIVIHENKANIFLSGYKNAGLVRLAGSFTNWEDGALAMTKSAGGWFISVNLEPGKHLYKFIADGQWLLHNDNLLKENDGQGNTNSVLFIPNHVFRLTGFQKAAKVYVSGSFNGWAPADALMQKTTDGWQLPVYLPEGTHTYRFVADRNWMADPANIDKVVNEFGEFNSVVRIGKPYIFRLDGFENAREVILVGSFNKWNAGELKLEKREGGWEIPYTIGAGNHEYYYLVDGDRIGPKPPAGDAITKNRRPLNFNTVIAPNYTFILKGYKDAQSVCISGSFNHWSENGFPMAFENGVWKLHLNLPKGKQTYKLVVDGKWILDPGNSLWEQNEFRTKNSVLWIE
jgi:hypothetical protein